VATLLIADDDEATRLLVRTVLEHAGHRVVEAADGAKALSAIALERPDLVLLDLSMPAMGGPELMRTLRADPATRSIAVALYSAMPLDAQLRDFMEIYGICGLVPKPSEPPAMVAAVEGALRAAYGARKR
jgi:CheY-like chemotaxis protein